MASVKENLIAARAVIDTPEKWGQNEYCDWNFAAGAECFCAAGALAKAYGTDPAPAVCETGPEYDALCRALPGTYSGSVVEFNDEFGTTHADVMALFDRAIAAQGDRP